MFYSRRTFIGSIAALAATGAVGAQAEEACTVISQERQRAMTPAQAIKALQDGNVRFVAGRMINCDLRKQVRATANGQFPIAAIVGCIDSRVPPEMVFDQRIGDIFAARVAGNFINTDILGSLEFACKIAGSKAIVVLGHSECGAVKGAIDQAKLGNLTEMLRKIEPAVSAAKPEGQRSSKNQPFVQAVADANARLAVRNILEHSSVLKEMADKKEIAIVAAMHNIATGEVTFLS